jgi:catechol 2,3-dioxygenase-like lactoylglutathione lyase family enzyme
VFFKTRAPKELQGWYERHLGIVPDADGYVSFKWREANDSAREGLTVWVPFASDTTYFGPGPQAHMINYRVQNLDRMLEQLATAGVTIDPKREDHEYGRFAWIIHPDGNRVELWEPPPPPPKSEPKP